MVAVTSAAGAQQPPPVRIRGTIESVDGNLLTLKSGDGAEVKLMLPQGAMIVAVVKAALTDIKEGTFLGSAAMPQSDGTQKAVEPTFSPSRCAAPAKVIGPIPRLRTAQ